MWGSLRLALIMKLDSQLQWNPSYSKPGPTSRVANCGMATEC